MAKQEKVTSLTSFQLLVNKLKMCHCFSPNEMTIGWNGLHSVTLDEIPQATQHCSCISNMCSSKKKENTLNFHTNTSLQLQLLLSFGNKFQDKLSLRHCLRRPCQGTGHVGSSHPCVMGSLDHVQDMVALSFGMQQREWTCAHCTGSSLTAPTLHVQRVAIGNGL